MVKKRNYLSYISRRQNPFSEPRLIDVNLGSQHYALFEEEHCTSNMNALQCIAKPFCTFSFSTGRHVSSCDVLCGKQPTWRQRYVYCLSSTLPSTCKAVKEMESEKNVTNLAKITNTPEETQWRKSHVI